MKNTIPFLDMKSSYLEIKDELDKAYHRVMDSGWYIAREEADALSGNLLRTVEHNIVLVLGTD